MFQYVPSPAHELRIGVSLPSDRSPETSAGSSPKAVAVTITSASALFSRLTAALTLFAPVAYVSLATISPPSSVKRASNASTTFLK